MISFDQFTMSDLSPIYLQIITYLKRSILAGTITDGDELPSRRVLSALLGVNPNTVQKAYRLLEDEGLIASHTGAKSVMVVDDEAIRRIRIEVLESDAKTAVQALRSTGISKADAIALIERYWETEESK